MRGGRFRYIPLGPRAVHSCTTTTWNLRGPCASSVITSSTSPVSDRCVLRVLMPRAHRSTSITVLASTTLTFAASISAAASEAGFEGDGGFGSALIHQR